MIIRSVSLERASQGQESGEYSYRAKKNPINENVDGGWGTEITGEGIDVKQLDRTWQEGLGTVWNADGCWGGGGVQVCKVDKWMVMRLVGFEKTFEMSRSVTFFTKLVFYNTEQTGIWFHFRHNTRTSTTNTGLLWTHFSCYVSALLSFVLLDNAHSSVHLSSRQFLLVFYWYLQRKGNSRQRGGI